MSSSRSLDWNAIDEIFQAALTVPAGDRSAWVAGRCGDDEATAREVASLLRAHERSTGFLEPPAQVAADAVRPSLEGARIGPYELVRELGHGGMGTVYLGRRTDGAFDHEVAVKLTHSPVPSTEIARRFDAERRILASLSHRNIVTLLDGGTTPSGHPYLITEYIDGPPITVFARERRLSLEERLRTFRQVCGAVHAAHQHGIVHRDLKPANILVTADGSVKVLDFGIAKLVTPGLADQAQAVTHVAPMTPSYASPEQLRGQAVTTASDVYALGVVLFELVAGVRPREVEGSTAEASIATALEGPSVWPSRKARAATDLPYDARRIEGDLDAIVLKAMREEPDERYGSADELSRDIGRLLDGHPVVARKPSFGYLAAKLARRHLVAVAVALVAVTGVVAALGVALWQRQQADAARTVAEARATDLRKLAGTLIFTLDDVVRSKGPTEARKLIVSEALAYLNALAATSPDPALSIELAEGYLRVGDIQGNTSTANLGDPVGAAASARRALALAEPLEGHAELRGRALGSVVRAHRLLVMVLPKPESVEAGRRAVATAERWRQSDGSDAARFALAAAYFNLATQLTGPEERQYWEAAGQEYEALLAEKPDDPGRMRNVALVDKYLTSILVVQHDEGGARRHAERAARLDARRLELHPADRQARIDAAISFSQLADRLPMAERVPLLERSIALREQVHLEDPANEFAASAFRRSWIPLARARLDAGDLAGARVAVERARTAYAAVEGRTITGADRHFRGRVYLLMADLEERERGQGAGCRWLRQAQTEFTQSSADRVNTGGFLKTVRERLAACGA